MAAIIAAADREASVYVSGGRGETGGSENSKSKTKYGNS